VSRITLKPGDLVVWDPEQEGYGQSTMLVSKDGKELLFQFGTKPWSGMEFSPPFVRPGAHWPGETTPGYTAPDAARILSGEWKLALSGFIYKSYDAETGESYPDPRLELE